MLKQWRDRQRARVLAVTWCDGCDGVCTAECRSDALRERARDAVFTYPAARLG
jgi:Pyruvate/2-oxoacid:ferredoxin oxidoreductase delta subunit